MNTVRLPPHLVEIKTQLNDDQITWQEAIDNLRAFTEKKKPWHTKEWKITRQEKIQDLCVQCGDGDNIMVLQHLWHPERFNDILKRLSADDTAKHWEAFKSEKIQDNWHPDVQKSPRNACPSCQSINVKFRKKMDHWVCCSTKSKYGRIIWRCANEFSQPSSVMEYSPAAKQALSNLKGIRYHASKEALNVEVLKKYGKKAVLFSIEQSERYYSCVDTVTFCKPCAANWDLNKIKICPQCKGQCHIFLNKCLSCMAKCDE
ncbi:MAG: hypothetical protein HRT51_19585 [Colwellia sp.]|nr:hypothetical protein [Colwellia sp.]